MSTTKTKPNNREIRKLHELKLFELLSSAFNQFKKAADSYQHPALPINCYYLMRCKGQLEQAFKDVKRANDEGLTLSPFAPPSDERLLTLKILVDLHQSEQFEAFNTSIKEQADLRRDVDEAFSGFSMNETDLVDFTTQKWCHGPILKAMKIAYIDALLAIKAGKGAEVHKLFLEQVQQIKVDHIEEFEARVASLRNKYLTTPDDGEAGLQEYDMDRDPLGRREADPRQW